MRRFTFLVLAISVLGAGCDDDGPTAPSTQPLVFSALLSPANEVPAVSNVESGGNGAMQVTVQTTRSASGAITGATANFHIQLNGFPGDTVMVGAHIHTGVAGVNGPVRVSTGFTTANTLALEGGSANVNVMGIVVDAATAEAIANNPSAFYFNVHSPRNPGGFARGQLMRVQ